MSLSVRKIPVFVFPNSLKFYLLSKTTHKQLLTLYNPYDFPVNFKVFSTAPKKYNVIDPEGSIGPHMLVDIVVRHIAPTTAHCNVVDKLRISMQDHSTKQVIGKRDIEATLLPGERESSSNDGDFHSLSSVDQRSVAGEEQRTVLPNRAQQTHSTNYVIAIIVGVVCVVSLMLPTHPETPVPSVVPEYLHVSTSFKLVLAYVLGLVTMVIFRP